MYHSQLTDAIFYNSPLALDRIIAEQVRQFGCLFCHGNLHQSHTTPADTREVFPKAFIALSA